MIYNCWHCEEPRNFAITATQVLPDEGPPEEYSFAICETCHHPAVFYREDMGDGFENDAYYRLYPPHDRHIGYILPDLVRESYEDAVRCENAKLWTPAAVMVGRALEAVCREYAPGEKSIHKGLQVMEANGLISKELLQWADQLRLLRNMGAHPSAQRLTREDATEGIDFLQAILEIMYDLRPRFEKMKLRRAGP